MHKKGGDLQAKQSTAKRIDWFSEIKTPPVSLTARCEIGLLLRDLQEGRLISMPHSRPMPSIGGRVHELRVNDEDKTWRVVYRIDKEALVILEVFSKKTQTTPQSVINTCKARIKCYDAEKTN